jgi:hypothetical protein
MGSSTQVSKKQSATQILILALHSPSCYLSKRITLSTLPKFSWLCGPALRIKKWNRSQKKTAPQQFVKALFFTFKEENQFKVNSNKLKVNWFQFANFFGTESASNIREGLDLWQLTCHCCKLTSMHVKLTGCKCRTIFAPPLNSKLCLWVTFPSSLGLLLVHLLASVGTFQKKNFGTKATGERFVSHPNDFLRVVPSEFWVFS